MTRTCFAMDCGIAVPHNRLMCKAHWYMLPKPMRDAIWSTYQAGQERQGGPRPSEAYITNIRNAQAYIAEKTGQQPRLPLGKK